MEIEISKLKVASEDKFIKDGSGIAEHPNYQALTGMISFLMEWCQVINQDWRDRMFRLLWVYNFMKNEGQTKPIAVDKNYKIITGHKRAAAMLAQGHKTIDVKIIDYEKIGQK